MNQQTQLEAPACVYFWVTFIEFTKQQTCVWYPGEHQGRAEKNWIFVPKEIWYNVRPPR